MRTSRGITRITMFFVVLSIVVVLSFYAGGGTLEPNAPPGPTMHTLDEIYNLVSSGIEPPPQPFAFDCFLKIDGIPGESTDDAHKDWIEVLSYSHGVSQIVASSDTGRTAERCDHQDFSVTKYLDKSSPALALYCCVGEDIPEVTVELCRAMGDKEKYMEYKMSNAIVVSVKPYVQLGEALPVEEVTFNYGKIEWTYIVTDGNSIHTGWDVDANTPIDPCGVIPTPTD